MDKKLILVAAFGLLFVSFGSGQTQKENYSQIFSNDYQRALQFLRKEKGIDSVFHLHMLNAKEVTAIVFPELIRYNSIQDKVETFALETLYVQYGKAYANFSVGEFQIKPEFAERIEIDFLKQFGEKELLTQFKINAGDTIHNPENRMKRLRRIKNKVGMASYLCLFWKMMNTKYSDWKDENEKIKFLATAYNCGYWRSKKEIESFQSKKFFHTGLSLTSAKYRYGDIALYYFEQP